MSPENQEEKKMKMRKMIAAAAALTLTAACMASCGDSEKKESNSSTTEATTAADTTAADTTESTEAETTTEAEEDEEENYDTGDASLDNIRNQDEIGDNELLVISFGTSFNDSRRLTIGAIENALEKAFPDYAVRRGFTANIVIDHVNKRDGVLIDDIDAALKRAVDNEVKNLVVQPTHLMNGLEYEEVTDKIAEYSDAFDKVVIGEPLLTSDDDFAKVEKAITDWTKDYDDGETAICFMGHGTEAASNAVYQKMQDLLSNDGFANYYVGTVEAEPSLEDVIAKVKEGNYKKVVLEPLMVVAGDHANNDMAGDDEDSWKSAFLDEGFEVECLLRGLGENEDIQKIYVEHAQKAIDSIK
jgi:sirohydrochlorin cobaltochelatase